MTFQEIVGQVLAPLFSGVWWGMVMFFLLGMNLRMAIERGSRWDYVGTVAAAVGLAVWAITRYMGLW